MRIKRVLCFAMVLASLMTMFVCLPAALAESTQQTVLNYWYPWGGDSEKWDLWRISEFEKANPDIKVVATYVPPDGGLQNGKLLAAIAGGTPPDLVVTGETANGYSLRFQDALTDMTPYLENAGFTMDMVTPALRDVMQDGIYVVPMDSNVIMLFYNKTLFKEAGLDPEKPPTTVAELDEYARKLDKIDGDNITTMGFIPWMDSGDDPFVWSWIFGAEVSDKQKNTINITDTGMVDYLNWQREYAKRYDPARVKAYTSGFGELFSPDHAFMTGKVAMTTIGNWMNNALRIYAPDLDYGVVPLPAPEGGRSVASPLYTNLYMVPAGAKNPDAAARFIMYCFDDHIVKDNIDTWFTVPVMQKAFENIQYVLDNDFRYKVVQQLAMSTDSAHVGICSVSGELRDQLKVIRDDVIYNDKDPLPMLQALQDKLTAEIAKQG